MKNIRISIISMLLVQCALGQYYTPGTGVHWELNDLVINSGGVLTFEAEKYLLWNDLFISQNDTLSISTDEEIRIDMGFQIKVLGVLISQPPVGLIITAMDTTSNFKGLSFDNSDGSVLKKCRISFGGGIKLVDSDIVLDSCIIRNNNQANSTGVIDMINSNPIIKYCRIYDNLGPAVLSAANGNSSPQIIGNHLVHNCSSNLNMPQINLGTSSATDTIRIITNIITGLYQNSGGIALATLAGGSIKGIVEGNTIENNRFGITAYGMNIFTLIKDNLITDNNIQGDPLLGGSGINFWGDVTNSSIVTGNEITGNLWGITVQNQALPNLGKVDPDTLNPGENLIFDNGNSGEIYALYNNTPNDLFAENNYWGTFDPDTVEMYIFHQPDDPALGFVDYIPIKDYLTGSTERKENMQSGLKVFPNPAETTIFPVITNNGMNIRSYAVQILDIYGNIVFAGNLSSVFQGIDISFLSSGLYVLRVETEQGWLSSKWEKQ